MPLFLRSLPLSLVTLWHYIFVLPIVLIFALPLSVLTLLPLAGIVISVTIFTFIAIMGHRCALAALGRGNEPDVVKLVKSSMFFGVINTLMGVLIALLCISAVLGLMRLGVEGNVAVPWGDSGIPWVPSLAVLAVLVVNGLYNCAIAVPMAEAAHSATESGRSADPLFGIGRGMFSLALIWILWLVGIYNSGLIEFTIYEFIRLVSEYTGLPLGDVPIVLPERSILSLIGAWLFLLWGTCWYYATAALAWEDELKGREIERTKTVEVARVSADELRKLREARMQKTDQP